MRRRVAAACCLLLLVTACGPGFQSNITPIRSPLSYPSSHQQDSLQIGFDQLSPAEQIEHFGVDMTNADVVPIRVVVRNDGTDEFYIQAEQIFGRTANGDLYPGYRLDQSVERIRQSELGAAMARGAAAGILVGAAVGVAAGAALGAAVGDAGSGAALGAATGGTAGGLSGAAAGADSTSRAIKQELRKVDWGNRVIYPGRIEHGFLFLKSGVAYEALEVLIYNVNKRQNTRIAITL